MTATQAQLLEQAHAARDGHRFGEAYEAFARAQQAGPLSTEDVLAWGDAAWWLGKADHALELAEAGHRRLLDDGQDIRAAMEAINLGFLLMMRGDMASGSGWLQRGRSLVGESKDPGGSGYVTHLDAEQALHAGDLDKGASLARQAQEAARASSDSSLLAMALMTEGTARLRAGDVAEGMALLDESMLPVQAGEIRPEFAGNLYCQMIAICWELADLRRAREWTAATERWCENFDSALMFTGICRMHRVQLRQVAGDWDEAAAEADIVCRELVDMNTSVVAEGHYLRGDLLRLRGDIEGAEAAYRLAHELGRVPQPGLALLRWHEGRTEAALASLRSELASHRGADYSRAPLLRAIVDIAVAAGQPQAAREGADELTTLAERWQSDGLRAAAGQAQGTVALAERDEAAAIGHLRDAVRGWQELDAPYDCAVVRMTLAKACIMAGDRETATLELDAAHAALTRLDATIDLRRLDQMRQEGAVPGGLTRREAEILAHVAAGVTNREVADVLVISEKTVARHLANIYLKLGVSTRTAAAAWARANGIPSA